MPVHRQPFESFSRWKLPQTIGPLRRFPQPEIVHRQHVRPSLKIKNISAVQRPIPRTASSSLIASSSDNPSNRSRSSLPSMSLSARSLMYEIFCGDNPTFRSLSTSVDRYSLELGNLPPYNPLNRSRIALAADPANCWKTIEPTIAS